MNWEAIGAIGEVGGMLAVVATLIYLASQLNQNTQALKSASYEHWNTITSSFADYSAAHADDLAEAVTHNSIDDLSTAQFLKVMGLFERGIVQAETAFLLHRAGNMDEDVFQARMNSFLRFFDFHPLGWAGWEQSKLTRVVDFAEYVDKRRTAKDYPTLNPGDT